MTLIPLCRVPAINAQRNAADARAIQYSDEVLTWAELDRRSTRRAHALSAAGVVSGNRVTLALSNGAALFELLFALWKIGATPHIVSDRLPKAELRAILELATPRLLITSSDDLGRELDGRPASFGLDWPDETPLPETTSPCWKAMSSGGSTGRPKIILSPEPSTMDTAAPNFLKLPATGAIMSTGPLYHNMPFVTTIRALFNNLQVVGLKRFDPEEALRIIDREKIVWTNFVPTMMMRISRLPAEVRDQYDVSSLRTVWHWAAPMPPSLKEEWIDWLGAEKIWELYGGTEAIATTALNGEEWLAHPTSVGRPVGNRIKILDEHGREVPTGTIGEIYSLPDTGQGSTYAYVGSDRRSTPDGYETLGDQGWLDEDGYVYIADRRTDMIISGGANVYPAEVENALMAHPDVEAAVVIGLPHPDLGSAVHAIVQPVAGRRERLDSEVLSAFALDRLIRYKVPRSFEFVDHPLRDDAGKVRRQQLREERNSLF